ncbi:hypothetical protein ACFU7Y_29815 [Kitasatospora sp. NPDC057542]|uniref:hypothetical protein n=1 Tax=Kitasatospora sp. NPDC057542 TaxID=3346162 RepID=UPI00368D250B
MADHLTALLTAAGHPLALVSGLLGQGDVDLLRTRALDQVRTDLREFARTVAGRSNLLLLTGRLGLSEVEAGRLAGVVHGRVRKAAGKGTVPRG